MFNSSAVHIYTLLTGDVVCFLGKSNYSDDLFSF